MANTIECATHGRAQRTFVCCHLLGESVGLGFNRNDPTAQNPFPDAWCDDCELIHAAHDGWNEESQKLTRISLLCSGCYERARIRNTRTSVTLDDLAGLRWKCGSCEELHAGPCLDISYTAPYYWSAQNDEANPASTGVSNWGKERNQTFLNEDYCVIDDHDFFVRGIMHLPIIGTAKTFCWGVWGSVSRDNFELLLKTDDDPRRVELPMMFSWLSTRISGYPDTLNLKMYAQIEKAEWRPNFELELTDHPLSQEYHKGITPERIRQIMSEQFPLVQ